MYNRYIPNDQGVYVRVTEPEPWDNPQENSTQYSSPPPAGNASDPQQHTSSKGWQPQPGGEQNDAGVFQHILSRLHLADLDTGDLLLLAIMFLLFKDNGDEELLMALGLLLIL